MKFNYPELEEKLKKETRMIDPLRRELGFLYDEMQKDSWESYIKWEKKYFAIKKNRKRKKRVK